MEVYFASRALEKKLATKKARVRHFGAPVANKLTLRLGQLSTAPTLGDMRGVPGNCHELREDRVGQLAIAVSKKIRLIFEPADDPTPKLDCGGLDWDRTEAIRLLEVVDYHGD